MDDSSLRQEDSGRVRSLRRRELSALKDAGDEDAWQEVGRRQAEVLAQLDEAIELIVARCAKLEEEGRQFSARAQMLRELAIDTRDKPDASRMRKLGQEVHDAHVELIIHGQVGGRGSDVGERLSLRSFTFGELVRVGTAMGLPLAVAMCLSALIIGVSIALVFGS